MSSLRFAKQDQAVEVQAFAFCRLHKRPAFLEAEGKTAARLDNRENTDQPFADSIPFGHLLGAVLHSYLAVKIHVQPILLGGHRQRMVFHPLCIFHQESLPRAVFSRALHTFLPRGERLDSQLRSDMWESFRRKEVRDYIVRMCAGYQGTLAALARKYNAIQTPTLVLWAEQDKHFPFEQAARLHQALPNASLEVIPGAQHWMPLTLPAAVAGAIVKFASR